MIQVYTGNGKGKTTASLGLALRAAGAGKKVYLAQFCKGRLYNEIKALKKIKNIKIEQFGRRCFIKKSAEPVDVSMAKKGLDAARKKMLSRKFGLVILDEINIAVKLKLVSLKSLIELAKMAPQDTELVLTGRYAHPQIIRLADLASEVKELKHYYSRGQKARRGIEF